MPRRSSVVTDLMELSSRLPWALALGLALGSYAGLHWVAVRFSIPLSPNGMSDLASVYVHSLVATLTGVLQYILPLACIVGALLSAVRRSRGATLFTRAVRGGACGVDTFTWSEFEHLVGEAFRRDGYTVRGNAGGGPDGGLDLVLQKGPKQLLVQCKHWRNSSVGVAVIREFFGVMAARGADGGFVVTSGSFTTDARDFGARCGIGLIDGRRLRKWISTESPTKSGPHGGTASVTTGANSNEPITPACPKCGVYMVLRTARRGPSTGETFWGCTRFPHCRETQRS